MEEEQQKHPVLAAVVLSAPEGIPEAADDSSSLLNARLVKHTAASGASAITLHSLQLRDPALCCSLKTEETLPRRNIQAGSCGCTVTRMWVMFMCDVWTRQSLPVSASVSQLVRRVKKKKALLTQTSADVEGSRMSSQETRAEQNEAFLWRPCSSDLDMKSSLGGADLGAPEEAGDSCSLLLPVLLFCTFLLPPTASCRRLLEEVGRCRNLNEEAGGF